MFKWYYYLFSVVLIIGGWLCVLLTDTDIPDGCANTPATYDYIRAKAQELGGVIFFTSGIILYCLTLTKKQ